MMGKVGGERTEIALPHTVLHWVYATIEVISCVPVDVITKQVSKKEI